MSTRSGEQGKGGRMYRRLLPDLFQVSDRQKPPRLPGHGDLIQVMEGVLFAHECQDKTRSKFQMVTAHHVLDFEIGHQRFLADRYLQSNLSIIWCKDRLSFNLPRKN